MLTVQCCSLSRAMLNTRSPGLILRWLLSFTGVELFAPECWPHYGYGPWHYPFWSLDMFGVLCIWNGCYFSPSLGSHSATDQQLFLKSINFGYCPNLKPIVLVVYHLATLQQGRPMEFTAGAPVSNNHRCCLMMFICFRVCTIWDRWGCALRHRLSPAGAGWFLIAKFIIICNVKETKVSKYLQYVFGTKAWILLSGGFKIPQMRWSKLSRIGPF